MTVLPPTAAADHDRRLLASRTLSTSDFTLARTCDAKLFFRENRYPDKRDRDAYLNMLAEGGYMVEALAKTKFPDGIQLDHGRDVAADLRSHAPASSAGERHAVRGNAARWPASGTRRRAAEARQRHPFIRDQGKVLRWGRARRIAGGGEGGRTTRVEEAVQRPGRMEQQAGGHRISGSAARTSCVPRLSSSRISSLVDTSKQSDVDGVPGIVRAGPQHLSTTACNDSRRPATSARPSSWPASI